MRAKTVNKTKGPECNLHVEALSCKGGSKRSLGVFEGDLNFHRKDYVHRCN